MKKLSLALMFSFGGAAFAQTPAANMMPDGSRDMYAGLGVGSAPLCDGSDERKTRLVPNIQVQWSNGIFLKNASLGMHLSDRPGIEYGPILEYERGCDASPSRKLEGARDIDASLGVGVFFNYYPVNNLRLSSRLLVGTESERRRVLLSLDAKKYMQIAPHHGVAVSFGLSWANQAYAQTRLEFEPLRAYFANAPAAVQKTGYSTHSGVKDVHAGVNWNWELNPSWLVTSQASIYRLTGSVADNPLNNRRSYMTVYTGLAYRF
ncbi:MAG: MipA/OmpV family protein [Pseudomonadota bacterium]